MKSVSIADDLRKKGNDLFLQKDYWGALELYTKSIQNAPYINQEDSDVLALAHANRSAALYHLEEHKACIQDIEAALSKNYPADRRFKVLQRKGQCFMKQGRYSVARAEFEKALQNLTDDSAASEKRRSDLKSLMNQCERAVKKLDFEPPYHIPKDVTNDVIVDKSTVIINASSAVALGSSETRGRFLVADKDILAGELLIREQPFAATILKDQEDFHCHHCFTPCLAPIPCLECVKGRYCSSECRTNDWRTHHQAECEFQQELEKITEFSLLSLRILLAAGKDTLSKHLEEVSDAISRSESLTLPSTLLASLPPESDSRSSSTSFDASSSSSSSKSSSSSTSTSLVTAATASTQNTVAPPAGISSPSEPSAVPESPLAPTGVAFLHGCTRDGHYLGGYPSILHLEAHYANHSEEELAQYSKTSLFVARLFHQKLVLPVTMETMPLDDLVEKLASILLYHTRQLKTNSHAITAVKTSRSKKPAGKSRGGTVVEETSQVRVATAVYPTASLMNHACQPNVIVSYHKGEIFVRATMDIPKGGEILHCYGPHASHMTTTERQKALKDQYCFTCDCSACSQPSQPPIEESDACFRCAKCGKAIGFTSDTEAKTSMCTCKSCGREVNLTEIQEEGEKVLTLLSRLNEVLSSAGGQASLVKDIINKARPCVESLERLFVSTHMNLALAYDFMAKCHASIGQFVEATQWLSKSLLLVEDHYGKGSIEVAHELFKLAQLHFNGKEVESAKTVVERALTLFVRHYGSGSDEVTELLEMKACLMSL